jgi:hypothetical protein
MGREIEFGQRMTNAQRRDADSAGQYRGVPGPKGATMRGLNFLRRRKNKGGLGGGPTWQDNMPSRDGGPGQSRYLHIPEIDRWRAVPFDMPPAPERRAVMERVYQLTQSLHGAIDEGTGGSLDRLIGSWAGSWIATVESEYVDHCAVINVHRGQAQQWLTEANITAKHQTEQLEHIRLDYFASRTRLTGESPDPVPSDVPLAVGAQDPASGTGFAADTAPNSGPVSAREAAPVTPVTPATPAASAAVPPRKADWSAPHLVADRSAWALVLVGCLVLVGALADTVVFKNILELILRTESGQVAWLLAAGATSMALVAAGSTGVALAVRRRGRLLAPRHRPSRLPLIGSASVWLGLGLAMFLIRWRDNSSAGVPAFNQTVTPVQSTLWVAMFFAAIYLISGACTMFEAERLYNPEYFAFRRLRKRYRKQAERVAKADAGADRARAALELHDGELERERQRRIAAIADRKALAAEAANYARVLMAAMMHDPAKTGITETGPVPELISPQDAG